MGVAPSETAIQKTKMPHCPVLSTKAFSFLHSFFGVLDLVGTLINVLAYFSANTESPKLCTLKYLFCSCFCRPGSPHEHGEDALWWRQVVAGAGQ